jgi:hypothetical protein
LEKVDDDDDDDEGSEEDEEKEDAEMVEKVDGVGDGVRRAASSESAETEVRGDLGTMR